jgi:hypothetical protein
MRLSVTILLFTLIIMACEDPLDNQTEVPEVLLQTTLDIFEGQIIDKKADKIDDTEVWKVKIENSEGAVTSFYWRQRFNNIYKIVGESGPFDYQLNPPLDVVNYATARFLAFNRSNAEDLESWKLFRSLGDAQWFYQFFTKDSNRAITINAGSGEVVRSP